MACDMLVVIVTYTIIESIVSMVGNILLVLEYNGQPTSALNASYGYVTSEGSSLCRQSNITSLILEPNIFYTLQLVYIAIHVIWIISCLLLICQICNKVRSIPFFIPWYFTACWIFLMDIGVGTVVAIDYGNFGNFEGCISIGLVVFCFRGFVPIILNFIAMVLVALMMKDLKKPKAKSPSTRTKTQTTASRDSVNPMVSGPIVIPRVEEEGLPTRGVVAELQQKQRLSQSSYGYASSNPGNSSQFDDYGNETPSNRMSGQPVVRPPYVNVAYSPETERQYYDQQQRPYGNPNYQRNGYDQGEPVIYEDDGEYEDFDAVPPPAFPPRNPKWSAEKQSSAPVIPKKDYEETEKKVPPVVKEPASSSTSYEMRPFSYVNPSFRPADHLDIKSMKSNQVDIVKTLDEEIQHLKEQEIVSSSSEAETIIRTAIVKTYLNEANRLKKNNSDSEDGQRKKKKKKKKKMNPIVENSQSEYSTDSDEVPPPTKDKPNRVLEARV